MPVGRFRQYAGISGIFLTALGLSVLPAHSGVVPAGRASHSERLSKTRKEIFRLEKELIQTLQARKAAQSSIRKIRELARLHAQEREMGLRRMSELESTIEELKLRRGVLREKILLQQKSIRKALKEIDRSVREQPWSIRLPARERVEAPRRRVLANRVDLGLKEIEALKVDLADADLLEARIQEEQQQLAYLFQDLKEKESLLEWNKQLQLDVLRKRHQQRLSQLEHYRKLKASEQRVEKLIGDFNARIELERVVETERVATRAMRRGEFIHLKGQLPLPVVGKVVSGFGRTFDSRTQLYIFKKGIDILAEKSQPVVAVAPGKVAFTGELPSYGKVVILDHGGNYYSLCAHLGGFDRKTGDAVKTGDPLGWSDDAGAPVYFEIRARNVAVNPLQWISN